MAWFKPVKLENHFNATVERVDPGHFKVGEYLPLL